MYAHSGSYHKSLLFDKKLIELGCWSSEDSKKIEKWNETIDYELQKGQAARLISYLILRILGDCSNSRGRMRAKRLGTALANFEQILISAKGLEKKFYRDHLNHIIRVALLAMAIGRRPPFNLSSNHLEKLVLSCLFHDVGYPLSRIGQSFQSTAMALKNCYNIAYGISQASNIKPKLKTTLLTRVLKINKEMIEPQLKEFDHGILGAQEFMTYLKEDCIENYANVIRAISFHSPSFDFKVDDSLLTILILADELQDWGRPVNLDMIEKIGDFQLGDNLLEGEYNTEQMSNYSVLKQIHSKSRNLNRIRLPKNFRFRLKFPVKQLKLIDLRDFEATLQQLFAKCVDLEKSLFSPSHFKRLYENNSPFENIYYGLPIPKEVKLELFDLLNNETISKKSPLRVYNAFLNKVLGELLFTSIKVSKIESFTFFSSSDQSIVLKMTCGKSNFNGRIRSFRDHKVLELALMLLAELRFYNICIQKIANFPTEPYPVEIGIEGFPEKEDFIEVLGNVRKKENYRSFEYLRPIRDCVFNDGFFLLEKL